MSTQSIENVGKIYKKVGTSSSKFCLRGRHRNQHKQRAQKKKLSSSLSLSLSLTHTRLHIPPFSNTHTKMKHPHTFSLRHTHTLETQENTELEACLSLIWFGCEEGKATISGLHKNYRSLLQKSPMKEMIFCKRDL